MNKGEENNENQIKRHSNGNDIHYETGLVFGFFFEKISQEEFLEIIRES